MADLTLTVGEVEFADYEIPDEIRGGGEQIIAAHLFAGGQKNVDTFGASDEPVEWAGTFMDEGAEARCQQLDAMRKAGEPVAVTWSSFSFLCIIRRFSWIYRRFYQIDYVLTLEVLENRTQPNTAGDESLESAMQGDFDDADGFSNSIGNTGLTSLMDGVSSTLAQVSSLTGAPTSFLKVLGGQVEDTIGYVESLISGADVSLGGLPALVSGTSGASMASALAAAVEQTDLLANAFCMDNSLTRCSRNIASISLG